MELMNKPEKEVKRKVGPLEKRTTDIRKIYEKILTQKYGPKSKYDEYENDFIQRLELMIATDIDKGL